MTTPKKIPSPCPFCGSLDVIDEYIPNTFNQKNSEEQLTGFMACDECGSQGPTVDFVGPIECELSYTKQKLITVWNTRPNQSRQN